MELSPRLSLSYVMAAQAQKHVTVNETFRRLDALVQLAVISAGDAAPPGGPSDGDLYIVGEGATGAWAGWDHALAQYADGGWLKIDAVAGMSAFDRAAGVYLCYRGAPDHWTPLGARGNFTPTVQFAVNGDFSPSYIAQEGRYVVADGVCHYWLSLGFSTNAYTSASGGVDFGGLPFLAENDGALAFEPCAAPFLHNVSFAANDLYAVGFVKSNADKLTLYTVRNGAPVAQMTPANFPPSTSPIYLRVGGSYRIAI